MAITTNSQQQEIKQILQKEVDCVNSLLKTLEAEYEALAEHHADALEDIVHEKQEKVRQLEFISRQRETLLSTFDNVTIDDSQINNKQYLFHDNQQLTGMWKELVSVAEKCRDKNRVNGSIVETVSRQAKHALDILRGIVPSTAAAAETYDNSGQTKTYTKKHSLVQV